MTKQDEKVGVDEGAVRVPSSDKGGWRVVREQLIKWAVPVVAGSVLVLLAWFAAVKPMMSLANTDLLKQMKELGRLEEALASAEADLALATAEVRSLENDIKSLLNDDDETQGAKLSFLADALERFEKLDPADKDLLLSVKRWRDDAERDLAVVRDGARELVRELGRLNVIDPIFKAQWETCVDNKAACKLDTF